MVRWMDRWLDGWMEGRKFNVTIPGSHYLLPMQKENKQFHRQSNDFVLV